MQTIKQKIKSFIPQITKHLAYSTIAVLVGVTSVYAIGTLTPTGTAGDDTQYTLNDIFDKLTDFTDSATEGSGAMVVPGTVSATFRTLSEIYALLEAEEEDLVPENIADGVEIFGVVGANPRQFLATGQTVSYYSNDDGDLEKGTTMSYTNNEDGTITDNITGFVWQQDGAYIASSWQDGIDYCINNVAELPGTGWRLPNYKELVSIVDLGRSPAINPIFTNTQLANYWTSSTPSNISGSAWGILFSNGNIRGYFYSGSNFYVRCVR